MITRPQVGSVWRENDSRVDRYVRVMGLTLRDGEWKAQISACCPDGSRTALRITRAKVSRFGKAYKPVETPQ